MSVHAFYRIVVWVPILVPALAAVMAHGFGFRPVSPTGRKALQLLLMMFFFGGAPYTALALWATFWIGRRPEREILWKSLQAPLLMATAFAVPSAVLFVLSRSGEMALGFFAYGAVSSVVVGFAFVGLTLAVREVLGRVGWMPPSPFLDLIGGN